MSGARGLSPEYKGHGVGPDGKDYVVVVPYNDRDHHECLANARLIAAAPDLYAVVKAFGDDRISDYQFNEMRNAALAKVERD